MCAVLLILSGNTPTMSSGLTTQLSGETTKAPILCQSRWSSWINTDSPSTGDGDREVNLHKI
jgi:hypothetical protein